MSEIIVSRGRPSSHRLLARILETPNLATQIRSMPADALARVIDRVGLEDAGEIVAFASTEQLARVFDQDLWRSERAGEDERFDAERFLLWLSVMLEAGDAFVANKLAELPPDLVTLAFHRQVLVLDVERMMTDMSELDAHEVNRIEKALSNCLSEEFETYQVIARQQEGWDDVWAAIVALDKEHHDFLMGVLDRCCAMSAEYIEDNGGLYDVLTSEEMLESDLAAEREDRRAELGHVSPSSAAAFLKLARTDAPVDVRDPLTRAYFRNLVPQTADAMATPDLSGALREAASTTTPRRRRLPSAKDHEPLMAQAMRGLSDDPAIFTARSEELAYLANVLSSGCSLNGERLRPVDAVRAALATCSLGLELAGGTDVDKASDVLRVRTADALFRLAWQRLDRDVVRVAKDALKASPDDDAIRALANELPTIDESFIESVAALRRARSVLR
jgi:Family of unknown function (DUF6178)